VQLVAAGAPPGATVGFARSADGPGVGPCPPVLGGVCLGITQPVLLGSVAANASGVATLSVPTPPGQRLELWFQAALLQAPSVTSAPLRQVLLGASADPDHDGLDATEEYEAGTHPEIADTDGDGALDGVELDRDLDPLAPDTDGDGLLDGIDLFPLSPSTQDAWTPQDEPISSAGVPDPEYDPATGRVVFEPPGGSELWAASIDPATGTLVPVNGRGTLITRNISPIMLGANGPEWVNTPGRAEVTFARPNGAGHEIWRAWETPNGWRTARAPAPPNTWGKRPYGQHASPVTAGRVIYPTPFDRHWRNVWRVVDDASEIHMLPLELSNHNTRWALDDEHLLVGTVDDGVNTQIFQYDIRTGAWEVLTGDATYKHDPYRVAMPEWGGEPAIVASRGTSMTSVVELVVYRQIGGAWQEVKVIPSPAAWPYVDSPEPFHWADHTYVSFGTAEWIDGPSIGISSLWIAALDPADPLQRMVSDDTSVTRSDAEPYVGGVRPWVIYSHRDGQQRLHRCELGL